MWHPAIATTLLQASTDANSEVNSVEDTDFGKWNSKH